MNTPPISRRQFVNYASQGTLVALSTLSTAVPRATAQPRNDAVARAVILIPGIMGTRLLRKSSTASPPAEVWPPTALETVGGYRRIDELLADDVVPGGIVRNVLCLNFYDIIIKYLEDLGYQESSTNRRWVEFGYDWRRDLFDTAEALANRLDLAHQELNRNANGVQISLVAHSMGGLIGRLVLESGKYNQRSWFNSITQLICIATPHLGAPLALGRILGIDSAMGVSGEDFKRFASDHRYPSGYQLLPPEGQAYVWDLSQPHLPSVNIFDSSTAGRLGLDNLLLNRTQALHKALGSSTAPNVRYFNFAAVGHKTATRVSILPSGKPFLTVTVDGGDGTVPSISSMGIRSQAHVAVNEHSTAFKGLPFKRVFFRLLGGDAGPPVETESDGNLALSLEGVVLSANQPIEAVLSMDSSNISSINGSFLIERYSQGGAVEREINRIAVKYSGPKATRFRFELPALQARGRYSVKFEAVDDNGDVVAESERVGFVVGST